MSQHASMHLLLVSTDFMDGGGGHLCLLRHLRRLKASGYLPSLLTQQLKPSRLTHEFCDFSDFHWRYAIPFSRWFWPPVVYRLPWTLSLRRLMVALDGLLAILRCRPDIILISLNGSQLSLWAFGAKLLRIPVGVVAYDLRELWADSFREQRRMEADSRRTLRRAAVIWFVSEELRDEYLRRVPGLNPKRCRILPPIPEGFAFDRSGWRDEFARCTRVTFAGGLKSASHDVFSALMTAMRSSGGRLVIITQEKRLPALEYDLRDYSDVLELRAIPKVPSDGVRWAAANSACLLVHYSFEPGAEELALTSFPSKLLEYVHLGLPVMIAAPPNTPVGRWALKRRWPLYLDSLDPKSVRDALERLKQREFWERCASESLETARSEFSPDRIHRRFESEIKEFMIKRTAQE